jgi:CheY-like chemotaxis protein
MNASPFARELEELRREYLRDAWKRLDDLTWQLARLDDTAETASAVDQALRRFHAFAGSGTSHGFPVVTQLGQEGERLCSDWTRDHRPRLQTLAALIAAELGPRPEAPATRVLCLQDNAAHIAFVRTVLESAGYEVRHCEDPAELDAAASWPDLLLVDRRLAPTLALDPRVPVVLLDTPSERTDGSSAEPDVRHAFAITPLAPGLLLAAIEATLARACGDAGAQRTDDGDSSSEVF